MSGVIAMVAPLIVFVALGWVALLVTAPFLPAAPAALTYVLGSQICHQISERSFHADGVQLPVCARCLGIYAGFAGGAMFGTLRRFVRGADSVPLRHRGQRPVRGESTLARAQAVVAVGAVPTVVTLLAEWVGLWEPSNLTRALAGGPFGAAAGLVVIAVLATVHYDECAPRPPISHDRPPSHI